MRKSQPFEKAVNGNAIKHDAYREAWLRIRLAQENGFFLEAITIQESIISDRLISFLSRQTTGKPSSRNSRRSYSSFKELIQRWRSIFPNGLKAGDYEDLIDAVDQWRNMRNEAIHAIVKSEPGQLTQSVEVFLEKAEDVAREGQNLAREVCNWCKRVKREEERLKQSSDV